MFTAIDERNGLVKVCWIDVRQQVKKVEPVFAAIIDELSPDQSYPLYLAYYPYGASDADTQSSLFPNINGEYYRITDPDVPKDIIHHLGYSANNTPLGMVLDKEIECYIDLKNDNITIPWLIYKAGDIFPLSTVLNKVNDRVYAPNGLLSSTAGARSAFMLPNIGATTNHSNLQRDFNIKSRVPKSLYEHWQVFREIVNSKVINSDWRCCVMYFSEKWLISLHNDTKWKILKQYLHELAWYRYEYERNRVFYDITFSIIQKNRNLKPNPYLADTAKHLFATALGVAPGYVPSVDNSALPVEILQHAFIESYGLKKYIPTIMQPKHFNFEKDSFPIYYSLQHPATHVFSPRSRQVTSTIYEMRELEHIMSIFIQELSKDSALSSDTIIGKIAKFVEFNYFHNTQDIHHVMQSSLEILNIDNRFNNSQFTKEHETVFAADASFLRGCVSIKTAKIPAEQKTTYSNDCTAIP